MILYNVYPPQFFMIISFLGKISGLIKKIKYLDKI